jgi:hypothetical protein
MAAPTRQKRSDGFSDGNADMVRGSILIGIAVIIGVVLLYRGFGDTDEQISSGATTTTVTVPDTSPDTTAGGNGDTTSTIGSGSSSTTTPGGDARPPAEITVRVANGAPPGATGVASKFTTELSTAGFVTVNPANGSSRDNETSAVYYSGDDRAEAEAVAAALGIPATAVAAMPSPIPTEDAGLNGATVLVVIGADKA